VVGSGELDALVDGDELGEADELGEGEELGELLVADGVGAAVQCGLCVFGRGQRPWLLTEVDPGDSLARSGIAVTSTVASAANPTKLNVNRRRRLLPPQIGRRCCAIFRDLLGGRDRRDGPRSGCRCPVALGQTNGTSEPRSQILSFLILSLNSSLPVNVERISFLSRLRPSGSTRTCP
jgi:hypothetical protein